MSASMRSRTSSRTVRPTCTPAAAVGDGARGVGPHRADGRLDARQVVARHRQLVHAQARRAAPPCADRPPSRRTRPPSGSAACAQSHGVPDAAQHRRIERLVEVRERARCRGPSPACTGSGRWSRSRRTRRARAQRVRHPHRARRLDHDPDLDVADRAAPGALEIGDRTRSRSASARSSSSTLDTIGEHHAHLCRAPTRGRWRGSGCGTSPGCASAKPDAAQPRNGFGLVRDAEVRGHLVAAQVHGAEDHGPARSRSVTPR